MKLLCLVRRAVHTIVFLILFKLSGDSYIAHCAINYYRTFNCEFLVSRFILLASYFFSLLLIEWNLYSNENNWNNKRFFSSTGLCVIVLKCQMENVKIKFAEFAIWCWWWWWWSIWIAAWEKRCGSLYRVEFNFYNWNRVSRCLACTWKLGLFHFVVILIDSWTIQDFKVKKHFNISSFQSQRQMQYNAEAGW